MSAVRSAKPQAPESAELLSPMNYRAGTLRGSRSRALTAHLTVVLYQTLWTPRRFPITCLIQKQRRGHHEKFHLFHIDADF